jgi:protein TonB
MALKIPSRLLSFLIAALLHVLLLAFAVFTIQTAVSVREAVRADSMKLADIREEAPAPGEQSLPPQAGNKPAENLVETGELESFDTEDAGDTGGMEDMGEDSGESIDFLPMHSVSALPRFPEAEIRSRMVYPPIAQRAGIEGTVYLELFVDSQGLVRNISILKEDPPGRGFGEAAARIFQGMRREPGKINGRNTALRYRYPVRFSLTD